MCDKYYFIDCFAPPCLAIKKKSLRQFLMKKNFNFNFFFILLHDRTVDMGAGGFGGLGAMGASMGNPNMVQTYQAMMQNIQKLIAFNPDFLTKGIPNNLLQMCMEQTKMPTMYGVSISTYFLMLEIVTLEIVLICNSMDFD